MPFALHIPLEADAWTPALDDQRGMHAILLHAWTEIDEPLAKKIHAAQINPFTQGLVRDRESGAMVWRITLLDDTLYESLMSGLHATHPTSVQRRAIRLVLDRIHAEHTTYDALYNTPVVMKHRLRFLSPTRFEQRERYVLFPDAYLCWQSWWRHWQAFAPPRLAINATVLDVAAAHLVVAGFRLHSQLQAGEQWDFVGAVGSMTFNVLQGGRLQADWWQRITALAAFSAYCGTGSKTAFGMGRTAWVATTS